MTAEWNSQLKGEASQKHRTQEGDVVSKDGTEENMLGTCLLAL